MISFKKFMKLLKEQKEKKPKKQLRGLVDVPRGAMQVSTRISELPTKPPYGFWVDRSGNFKVVPRMQHNLVAADMINRANFFLKRHGSKPIMIYDQANDPYDRLLENGWLRVVIRDVSKQIYYNGVRGQQPTVPQQNFLTFIKDLYDMNSVEMKF